MNDPFDLQRFVDAQQRGRAYESAERELRAGRKQTHWMWFVFPQIAGLGRSIMAERYAITGLPEARAFLDHPVLGPRLVECTRILAELPASDAIAIFGPVDAQKLRSSMTLFSRADPDSTLFINVLRRFFEGEADDETLLRL